MPIVTKILPQKRRDNRRNIYLDGKFAFGLNDNVVAQFRLREGLELSQEQVKQIGAGEVRQECFDAALKYIGSRLHSQSELRRKLTRREFGETVIDSVLADLIRLGYVDDAKFAQAKASSMATYKHHGRRRAAQELTKSGVSREVAKTALDDVYADKADSLKMARDLAEKKAPSLRRLAPQVARRRLAGLLARRGFDYETIKPVIDQVLGNSRDGSTYED